MKTIDQHYQECRADGFGIAESIRTAVSMHPELDITEALKITGPAAGTIRIQFKNSRAIDALMAA